MILTPSTLPNIWEQNIRLDNQIFKNVLGILCLQIITWWWFWLLCKKRCRVYVGYFASTLLLVLCLQVSLGARDWVLCFPWPGWGFCIFLVLHFLLFCGMPLCTCLASFLQWINFPKNLCHEFMNMKMHHVLEKSKRFTRLMQNRILDVKIQAVKKWFLLW